LLESISLKILKENMFSYIVFKVHHMSRPDKPVTIRGFGDRGVILKARIILASLGIGSRKAELTEYKAVME
jgi:hypothetical protein